MKKRVLALLGAVSATTISFAALGQTPATDKVWYGGISVGSTKEDFSNNALTVPGATASSLSVDDTGTGIKLFGGYQFSRNFSVEGGYTDLGKFRVTRNVTAPTAGALTANIKSSGFHLDAVGTLPLQGGFSLLGKVGGIYATTRTSGAFSGGLGTFSGQGKRHAWDWKWGVGASYEFAQNFGLRLEYENINNLINDTAVGKADVGMWSLGLTRRF